MQKQTIGLQCYLTIPRPVTILHDNIIDFNENINVFKDLNEFTPSYHRFPYEYIDAEVKKKLEKPKDNLQAIKWKRILNIMWDISIKIPTG